MSARPKGICLIINNFEFERSSHLPTGPADKENLTRTFVDLDFDVRYFENLTCEEMKRQMEQIRKLDHSRYDCFVCCISSHGNKTGVCGSDDYTVNITELQSYFYARQCVSLAGKPKVFFIDCCRGGEELQGIHLSKSAAPTNPFKPMISDKADFLLSFAATQDNVSWCNSDPEKGSVFFYHLTRLLELHAKSKTVTRILKLLNKELAAERPGRFQTAEYQSTLAKGLRFCDSNAAGPLGPGAPCQGINPSECEANLICSANVGKNDVLRVLLVGRAGAGKSTLGNALLNIQDRGEQFRVARGLKSDSHCVWKKKTWGDNCIEVVDTPGFCDPNMPEEILNRELPKSVALCHPGPHVIVYTARCDRRFTEKDYLTSLFPTPDGQRRAFREEITRCGGDLQSMLADASGRYLGMNNMTSPPLREQQARDLIRMMKDLVRLNGYGFYTIPRPEGISRKVEDLINDCSKRRKITHSAAADAVKRDISNETIAPESLVPQTLRNCIIQ